MSMQSSYDDAATAAGGATAVSLPVQAGSGGESSNVTRPVAAGLTPYTLECGPQPDLRTQSHDCDSQVHLWLRTATDRRTDQPFWPSCPGSVSPSFTHTPMATFIPP